MRLSEKTIELNFCSQLTRSSGPLVLWFGLTQRQEAQAGFDTCTRVRGRLLIFQFKASNYTLSSGKRRFYLQHNQLTRLKARINGYMRSVFYVFPSVGTTLELSKNANVPAQCWLLDVARLPTVRPPTTRRGSLRRNGIHYADVAPGVVTIHSEPIDVELFPASQYATEGFRGSDGFNRAFRSFEDFWVFCHYIHRTSAAAVIARPGEQLSTT